jgi:hypothetical protein
VNQRCCTEYVLTPCLVGNTSQSFEDDDFDATIDADTIYTPTLSSSNCIALELATDEVQTEICENSIPVADPQSLVTPFETPINITLTGSSIIGDFLFFTITTSPGDGTLSGSGDSYTYTPSVGFSGSDSFEFTVNDGSNESAPATITIVVGFVANDQSVEVNYETPLDITMSVTGIDPDSVTYTVTTPPTHGILSGTGRTLTYTPDAAYSGPDSFEFEADDGSFTTDPATVSITVLPAGVFLADFITLTYEFVDGLDLDTRTSISSPEVGIEVGWCQSLFFTGSNGQIWYNWGGDNTATGFESVLFYINAIRPDYPTAVLTGSCRAWWYNLLVSGDITISLKAYQGGTMQYVDGQFRWENVGGVEVASLTQNANVTRNDAACIDDPDCVTGFTYDLSTNIFTWTAC